ncbi:hypothetical protein ACRZ5O_01060 [Pseudomonas protegens]|jgi:hypothetical protein|uniref:hypothetical protein n=1 Tax=Pseudomonas protegens TaxID=380021 RepID=UPI003FD70627
MTNLDIAESEDRETVFFTRETLPLSPNSIGATSLLNAYRNISTRRLIGRTALSVEINTKFAKLALNFACAMLKEPMTLLITPFAVSIVLDHLHMLIRGSMVGRIYTSGLQVILQH